MKNEIFNSLQDRRGWLDSSEYSELSRIRDEIDQGDPATRHSRLRAAQKEIRAAIGPACERLAQNAMDRVEGALALKKYGDVDPTPEDVAAGEAGKEIFRVVNSNRVLEIEDVLSGEIFITE
jgi:hypothetical protein